MITVIAFVVILGLLILVHELGHFISAIKLGVDVEEFAIGFPPRLFSIKRKGIVYSINLIPIGGYVKIKGETEADPDDERSFANQAVWKRSLILSAGVLMNFFFAFVVLSIGFFVGLPQALEPNMQAKDISDRQVMVIEVLPDSPAFNAGIQVSDKVISIDGQEFTNNEGVYNKVQTFDGQPLHLIVGRADEILEFDIIPKIQEDESLLIGIGMLDTGIVRYGFFTSIWKGLQYTGLMIWLVLLAFYQLIASLISGGGVSADLSGPIGVAVMTGQIVKMGWSYVLHFAALLSINLGIINILPFPALDGGRLLFVLIEKVRRKKLNQKIEAIIHNSGFLLLILLLIVVTYKDFTKFGGQMWESIKNFF